MGKKLGLNKFLEGFALCLAYGLLFIIISFPLISNFGSAILGSGPDPFQYIWNADTFARALGEWTNPFFTDRVAYPFGMPLLMHTYTPLIGLLNLLFSNPYLSCNLALLLSVSIGGYGAFLLAKDLMNSKVLAFAAGLCFAFSPYMSSHLLEHYHLILFAPVPFFLRALLKLFQEPLTSFKMDMKQLGIVFLCFVLVLFSDYYTTFFLLFSSLFYFLFITYKRLNINRKQTIILLIIVWLISHVSIEYLYTHGYDDKGAFYNTADLLSFLIPPQNSLIYQAEVFGWLRESLGYKGPNEQVMFLGLGLIILLISIPSSDRPLKLQALRFMALFFFFLCLPKIRIMGAPITYSPTAFFHYLPFLNNIRNPARFVQMLYLILPVLALFHFDRWVLNRSLWWTLLIPMLFVLEYIPQSYPLIKKQEVGAYAQQLAGRGDVQIIWNLPSGLSDGFKQIGAFDPSLLQDQLIHQKKILGAYVSRVDDKDFERYSNEPMFQLAHSYYLQSPRALLTDSELDTFMKTYSPDVIVIDLRNRSALELTNFVRAQFKNIIAEEHLIDSHQLFYLTK